MMPVWLNCNKKRKKKTDTETFLSAKSWIFTIAIICGRILQNWEKRQKTRVIYLELQYYF
jgi:hypothetical protein